MLYANATNPGADYTPDPANGPLTPALSALNERLYRMTDTLAETLHRLRGVTPTAPSAMGEPSKQEPCVASLVMSCHSGAGRLSNLLDELNGLV